MNNTKYNTPLEQYYIDNPKKFTKSNKKNKKSKPKKRVPKTFKEKYNEFLKSNYWRQVKLAILERDNYTCRGCGATTQLEVHHLTYKNHLSEHKHLDDLATLCRNATADSIN
jgi:5-methylcytosine-specific restriction endonuclease McrA